MPKIFISCLLATAFTYQVNAQTAFSVLDGNNIRTTLNTGGVFFNSPGSSTASYEYPAQSDQHLIYASSFWFSGLDVNSAVKVSAQGYIPGQDMFPGPLTADGAATILPSEVMAYDLMWTVTKSEVDDHIANFNSGSYVMPSSIEYWPAHGDISLDQDFYLAPYIDHNSNGIYDPENGDYPLIRGDVATYMILNDKASAHAASGGDPIGIECHFMFYQYQTSDDLDNTTFINLKLINRGTQTLSEFVVGSFLDTDIGDGSDDFIGCDSTHNLFYSYNSSNTDAIYGVNPPAVGFVSLNHPLGTVGTFSTVGATGLPTTPAQYHFNMTGYFNDGSQRTLGGSGYGGTVPNQFQYHGNPNTPGEWSELDEGNIPSDRRSVAALKPITLNPNDEICYDFAIVVGDGGNNIENVDSLIASTEFVQDFYDSQEFICENYEAVVSIESQENFDFKIYPQPAKEGFSVDVNSQFDIEIVSLDGKIMMVEKGVMPNEFIGMNLIPGVYLAQINMDGQLISKRIIIE